MSFNSPQDAKLQHDSLVAAALPSNGGIVDVLDPCRLTAGAKVWSGSGPLLLWIAHGAVSLERRLERGGWEPLPLGDGDFYLSTSESLQLRRTHQCRSDFEGIRLHIGRHVLSRCAKDGGSAVVASQGLELRGNADPTLRALLELLCPPRSRTTSLSTPFVDGVAQAVLAQLACYPASAPSEPECHHHGLAPYKFRLVSRAMRERLTEPFDLEHLAGLAGLSTFHFSRAFKKASGVAPSRYFQRLRIEQAKRMLSGDDQSIIDIAMAVGFRSPSHFSQVFREVAGISPSEYRNRFASMQDVPTSIPRHART
ncbi:helix-turn-helix domain-containing protein [Massilia sp. BSC265]|uniref:helix-turn-helix domain-containing protein n=1 Tax=Massilia sp. BSC265 TaxID=1549812 RepID=UPI00068CC400|nr:AraC family transcriptional regulator [Massilia sp. BSC265]